MPSSNKLEKAEQKYNVVFDYPNLELHSAAAAGNVGLVHYALTHGQPVNSVLFGMLPMHAACSGGNTSVVRMLIERGADVNAPRLPLRYSEVKGKGGTAGTSGSTPLHFASANGHANLVKILLASGADPLKPDKNSYTPEALAQAAGHIDCVRVFRAWEHLSTGRGTGLEAGPTMSAEGSRRSSLVVDTEVPLSAPAQSSFVESLPPEDNVEVKPKEKGGFHGLRFRRSVDIRKGKGKAKAENEDAVEITPPVSPSAIPKRSATHRLAPNSVNSSHSSLAARRPSLPSIFEKAAHPGASLRAALHRDRRESDVVPGKAPPPPAASSFFRGRLRSNETGYSHSRASSFTESEYQAEGSSNPLAASRRYMSKHSLVGLFKRGGDTSLSRSPSPTRPNSMTGVDPEELELGLDRLQRASFDLGLDPDYSNTGSPSRIYDTTSMRSTGSDDFYSVPNSPSFSYLSQDPFAAPQRRGRSHSGASEESRPRDYGSLNTNNRPRSAAERPRTGSEVVSPSPLAVEWAPGASPQRPKLSPVSTYSNSPRSRGHTKKRSATMPSGFPTGAGWDEQVDLRKVASGVFRRESERAIQRQGTPPESPVDPDSAVDISSPIQSPEDGGVDVIELDGALAAVADGDEIPKPIIVQTEPTPKSNSPERPSMSPGRSDGRARGRSVSSMASTASALAQSFGQTSLATSTTPPSSMSAPFNGSSGNSQVGGFPPVPEHCTPGGSIEGSSFPFLDASMRRVSSYAEAKDLKLQSEREVLQAALMPPSQDSSLSLSQQLAAYGDSYILERELAEVERRKDRSRSEVNTLNSASSGGRSVSAGSSGKPRIKAAKMGFGEHRAQSQRSAPIPEPLVSSAPDTTQISINKIYDARAAAYRDRAKALTTAPPALQNYARQQRARRGSSSSDMWLTAGPARSASVSEQEDSERYPSISSPMPVSLSSTPQKPSRKYSGLTTITSKTSLPHIGTAATGSKPSFPPSSRSVSRPIRSASASTTGSAKLGNPSSHMPPPNSWGARSPFGGATSHDNSDSSDGGFQRRERTKAPPPVFAQPETANSKSKWGIKGMMEHIGRKGS